MPSLLMETQPWMGTRPCPWAELLTENYSHIFSQIGCIQVFSFSPPFLSLPVSRKTFSSVAQLNQVELTKFYHLTEEMAIMIPSQSQPFMLHGQEWSVDPKHVCRKLFTNPSAAKTTPGHKIISGCSLFLSFCYYFFKNWRTLHGLGPVRIFGLLGWLMASGGMNGLGGLSCK